MRLISRMTGVSINTVSKLLADAGAACAAFHVDAVRGVKAKSVECDEIWSFTCVKQVNVAGAKAAPEQAGDTWTWTALDADSKLIVSDLVGVRGGEYAMAFMDDVASRLANRVQMTTDGHRAYLEAVEGTFVCDVDYAQLFKIYGSATVSAKGRYSPAECTGIKKNRIEGNPDLSHVSTSYVERQNLTKRMHMRRFTRVTNAFSKKSENYLHMVALYTVFYNFCKIHKTLRVTLAMENGLSGTVRDFEWIGEMSDARAPTSGPRGPYKKTCIKGKTPDNLSVPGLSC